MDTKLKQEVMNLLPWYHLGKLTDKEKTLVEAALQDDPSLKEALLFEQHMMQKVKEDETLLDRSLFDSTSSRLNNVLAQIDQLEPPAKAEVAAPAPVAVRKPSLLSQLKAYFDGLLSGNSHSFTYAVFAALTVVQLSLLVLFIVPSDNIDNNSEVTYSPASYSEQTDSPPDTPTVPDGHMILLISMESHFQASGFKEILGKDVDVDFLPDDHGYYRVRLSKQLTSKEIEDLKNELSKKHGKVWFVGEEASY